jgi:hypothetical protein
MSNFNQQSGDRSESSEGQSKSERGGDYQSVNQRPNPDGIQPGYQNHEAHKMDETQNPAPQMPLQAQSRAEQHQDYNVSSEGYVFDDNNGNQESSPRPGSLGHAARSQDTLTPPSRPTTPPPQSPSGPVSPAPQEQRGFPTWVKYLLFGLVIAIIAAAVYVFFFYKGMLEISINEPGTKITAGSEKIGAGINKLRPGKYKIRAEKEGFVKFEKEIDISYFKKVTLTIALKEIPKLTKLVEVKENFLTYNKERDLYIFYVPAESAFYRVEASKLEEQSKAPLLTSPHYMKNLVDVVWNPDRMTAIIKIKNDSGLLAGTPFYSPKAPDGIILTYLYDFGRYDLLNQEAHPWGAGIGDIKFTPDGNQIAYYFEPGSGEKSLVVANKDNSGINRILDVRAFDNPKINWASDLKSILILNQSQKAFDTNKIYTFDLITKELSSSLTDTGKNLDAIFDPKNQKIIFTTYSSDPDFLVSHVLSVMEKNGQNRKELRVRTKINQLSFFAPETMIMFEETSKSNFSLLGIDINSLKETPFVCACEGLLMPERLEYIDSKNSIIFTDDQNAYQVFLTSGIYE